MSPGGSVLQLAQYGRGVRRQRAVTSWQRSPGEPSALAIFGCLRQVTSGDRFTTLLGHRQLILRRDGEASPRRRRPRVGPSSRVAVAHRARPLAGLSGAAHCSSSRGGRHSCESHEPRRWHCAAPRSQRHGHPHVLPDPSGRQRRSAGDDRRRRAGAVQAGLEQRRRLRPRAVTIGHSQRLARVPEPLDSVHPYRLFM